MIQIVIWAFQTYTCQTKISHLTPACTTLPKLPEALRFLFPGLSEDFSNNLDRFVVVVVDLKFSC